MYYPHRARELATNNSEQFQLAAWSKKRSGLVFGVNSMNRLSSKFRRVYPDGTTGFHLHAEMDLIRKFRPGSLKRISVIRFSKKTGEPTMSKPCIYCQKFLKQHGVISVRYTNWDGQWEILRL